MYRRLKSPVLRSSGEQVRPYITLQFIFCHYNGFNILGRRGRRPLPFAINFCMFSGRDGTLPLHLKFIYLRQKSISQIVKCFCFINYGSKCSQSNNTPNGNSLSFNKRSYTFVASLGETISEIMSFAFIRPSEINFNIVI